MIFLVSLFAGLASGFFESKPDFVSIPENKYFGFPLIWRMLNTATGETGLYFFELAIDCLFWFALVSIAAVVAIAIQKSVKKGKPE